jgi:hypothetical protein
MRRSFLRAIQMSAGTVLFGAVLMPRGACAEEAQTRVASEIEAQFMAWEKAGAFTSGTSIVLSPRDTVSFESDDPGNPFTDRMASIFTLTVDTQLPFIGVGERPAKDLGELLAGLQSACEKSGGTLKRDVPEELRGSTPQINQNLAVLKKASLFGRFTCQSAQEADRFLVEVEYARAPKSRLLPPSWDWAFVARLINARQLQAKERRASEYAAQIQVVRANVKPGLQVQVLASDLPAELGAPLTRYAHRGKPSVCAMVVDVKPPLAQIQVTQTSLFVPIEKLLPKGEAIPINNINWTKAGFPHKWCGQY